MHPESWAEMREKGSEGRWLGGQMGPCGPQAWWPSSSMGSAAPPAGGQDAGPSGLPYGGRQG